MIILALITMGVWGVVLREEITRRRAAEMEVAGIDGRGPHRVAIEPGPTTAVDTRIAE